MANNVYLYPTSKTVNYCLTPRQQYTTGLLLPIVAGCCRIVAGRSGWQQYYCFRMSIVAGLLLPGNKLKYKLLRLIATIATIKTALKHICNMYYIHVYKYTYMCIYVYIYTRNIHISILRNSL